jgi:hypothetical protein
MHTKCTQFRKSGKFFCSGIQGLIAILGETVDTTVRLMLEHTRVGQKVSGLINFLK